MTTCLSAQIRDAPDDPLNYFIGGCASGIFLGAKSEYHEGIDHSLHLYIRCAAGDLLLLIAGIKPFMSFRSVCQVTEGINSRAAGMKTQEKSPECVRVLTLFSLI